MKSNKFMFTILVIGLMAVFSITANAQKNEVQNENNDLFGQGPDIILGSWISRVTPENVPGSPPPFDHTITFGAGGGIVESSNINLGFPTTYTSGHGNWWYVGRQRFVFSYLKFFFDLGGNYIGTLKVEGEYTLTSRNSFSGLATGTFTDPAGNVLISGLANSVGTRIGSDTIIFRDR